MMAHSDFLKESREKLPIFKAKKEILMAISQNKTVIIIGETASGKTTQIPQYILEGGLARNKCIAITQPRRVAAITIAKRVAEEVRTELGGKVGYTVRFENVTSSATRIKYVTDGILLREAITDPLLNVYSVVILDEAHERTLNNDLLFGIVKSAQKYREQNKLMPLKIVVTSATVDHRHLSKYFNNAPAYFVPGRDFSIQILNTNEEQEDYMHSALITIFQIHQNEEEGDILVFCPGQDEIEKTVSEVRKVAQSLPAGNLRVIALPLFAALPIDLQQEVFKPKPPVSSLRLFFASEVSVTDTWRNFCYWGISAKNCRKVIVSTNIAETSVTIPGIKYVIDTGMMKAKSYNSLCNLDILKSQRISKAQAIQRAGRAGREIDGSCYRLYTVKQYEALENFSVPEILRCCLSSAILQMVALGIKNIQNFDFIDRPSDDSIKAAIRQLKLLDAVSEEDGTLELTECGEKMAKFPLDPRFSKMILTSKYYKCTDEILTIISLMSVDSIFYTAINQREKLLEARRKFESTDGDHIMLLNVYKAYRNGKGNPGWCHENFINLRNVKRAINIRKQLSQLCEKVDIPPCSIHNDTHKIRKCLASGLFMNAALRIKNKLYKMIDGNQKVKIHPTSCLFKGDPACCIGTELLQTSKLFMRTVSSISEEDLIEVAPAFCKEKKVTGFQLITVKPDEN